MKKILVLILSLTIYSCKKTSTDDLTYSVDSNSESAQQVADAMAGVDESGGTTNGTISENEIKSYQKTFARLSPHDVPPSKVFFDQIFPQAQAAACNTVGFSACSNKQQVRDLTGCTTYGGGAMTGNVTLNFSSALCQINGVNGDSVSRVPNYSITGLRGATFTVSSDTTGQTLTRTGSGTFTFANTGIRRTFTTPKGVKLLDVSTSTSGVLSVSGASRNARTISGAGSLNIINNLTGVSCALTPTAVTWTSACNCPTSGSWSGTCSDSKTYNMVFSATCGQATLTVDGVASTISVDRCQL